MPDIPGNADYLRTVLLDETAPTTGDMWYYDGTEWHLRAVGTAGQVLQSVGGVPAWAELDGDTVDIDGTPLNYTPNATAPAADADDLWAHLLGIDDEIGAVYTAIELVGDLLTTLIQGEAAEALDQYEVVYQYLDGTWYLAKTGAEEIEADAWGIVVEDGGIAFGETGTIRLQGLVENDAWSWTPGAQLFVDSTYGAITEDETAVQLGHAVTATQIWFAPGSGAGGAGFIERCTAGEALSAYNVCYANTADSGEYWKAQNDGTEAEANACAICVEPTGIDDGSAGRLQFAGVVENALWAWTPGGDLWLDSTAGGMTQTEPTGSEYHKPLGHAITATKILFLPQTGWPAPMTVAEGDLLVGNASLAWETLAAGTETYELGISGGVPAWVTGGIKTRVANDVTGYVEEITQSRGAAGQDNDVLWQQSVYGYNDAAVPEKTEFLKQIVKIADASNGTEDASYSMWIMRAGSLQEDFKVASGYVQGVSFYQIGAAWSYLYRTQFEQHSAVPTSPAIYAVSNISGASEALVSIKQDHASNTGYLVKGVHDGTGVIHRWERPVTADLTGGVSQFYRSQGSSAGSDNQVIWEQQFRGLNDAGTPEEIEYAALITGIVDASDGTEDGYISLQTMLGGALTEGLYIGGDGWGLKGHTSKTLSTGWSVTNLTPDKALDCDADDDLATADVLGTLITELIAKGVIAA